MPPKVSSCLVLFLLLFVFTCQVLGEFLVGRLSEGQFEYPHLNGWMTPRQAKQLCDEDQQCGGFTYKAMKISLDTFHNPFHS